MTSTGSIIVNNNGIDSLGYIDSGAPASGGEYTTIFAVHGVCFPSCSSFNVSSIMFHSLDTL